MTKYILVTGGVVSGIGKGVVTSSIGALLKACNLTVTAIKIDPYCNIDAGTFSPYEHGEVFVLDDGCEVDLDLGNYERALDMRLGSRNNITTGKIYQHVLKKERQGDYLGKTVQIVPHITDSIQDWIREVATAPTANNSKPADVCIIELGGTIGDIEGMPFVEAFRQFRLDLHPDDFCSVHLSWSLDFSSGEQKTKPIQASVATLRCTCHTPDMIVCRSKKPIGDDLRKKISKFGGVHIDRVFSLPDLKTTYSVPIELERQGIIRAISDCFKINICPCDRLIEWTKLSQIALEAKEDVKIALVGKYTKLSDCYTSVFKSLEHACFKLGMKPAIRLIDAEHLEGDLEDKDNPDSRLAWLELTTSHCLLVPGGFGYRGVEGKIKAIKYARENKMPFLGICLGFQMAVVEYARNVMSVEHAHSAEFSNEEGLAYDCEPYVIEMLEYQDAEKKLGGTMRLGLRTTKFVVDDSILQPLYGTDAVEERHRHRYEINPIYIDRIEKEGLRFVGRNEDGSRMEILELSRDDHPYFIGVQYHPEYLSRPFKPSPPYTGLISAAINFRKT